MRCPTCGENLSANETRCPTCGAAVAHLATPPAAPRVRRCPRCQYRGDGVGYFRRPGHVGLLVGVSVFTYGIGGLVYWMARRKHTVCPNCGLGWEHASAQLLASPGEQPARAGRAIEPAFDMADEPPLPRSGIFRRVIGGALTGLALMITMIGIAEGEAAAIAVAAGFGGVGSATFYWGWTALQERRKAIVSAVQRKILLLAGRRGGSLTVTEVAADLNLSLPAAERVLIAMDDGFRVRSEITKEGLILYEFPELKHRKQLGSGA